uniref:DUF7014 domain-containing protein n=1 Tax=Desulfomonile tiedjei TaxID=2358 RepID=A0A7C4AQW7_9BACT
MKPKVFSERHEKALREKKLRISFRQELRKSLLRLLWRYSIWGGWNNEENLTVDAVTNAILDRRGWDALQRWDGKQMVKADGFVDFIERGTPHHVLDAIELFLEQLEYKKRPSFIAELNNLFDLHHSPVRYFRNEFYVIDSAYLESKMLVEAQELLQITGFEGALDEFMQARTAFMEKNFRNTMIFANLAFESVLKAVLEMPNKRTGELIKKACHGGLVPSYYEGFLNSLHDFLSIVPTTRANEAAHGQGKDIKAISPALAELALHLSGSMIVFLIKRHLEKTPPQSDDDDIPF